MRHPTDGMLRRLVDEPAGVADADREHVAGCSACLAGLATARDDAAAVGAALDVEVDPDVDAAWHRLSSRCRRAPPRGAPRRAPPVAGDAAQPGGRRRRRRRRARRRRRRGRRRLAADLPHRADRPVAVTQADLVELPDLSAYGDVEVTEEATSARSPTPRPPREHRARRPAGRCAAARRDRRADLPGGRPGEGGVHVLGREGGEGRRGAGQPLAAAAARDSTAAGSGLTPVPGSPRSGGAPAACRP